MFPKDDPFAVDIHYHERCWDKGLLNDYHNFLFDLRREEKVYKISYIKTLISEEFKDEIIFRNRYQKNESTSF